MILLALCLPRYYEPCPEREACGMEAEINKSGYFPEGGSFFDQRGDEGYRHGVGHKGLHVVRTITIQS